MGVAEIFQMRDVGTSIAEDLDLQPVSACPPLTCEALLK